MDALAALNPAQAVKQHVEAAQRDYITEPHLGADQFRDSRACCAMPTREN